MNTHFSTHEYQSSHGQAPRGRGTWIFESRDRTVQIEVTGRFTAARARAATQHRDVAEWVVLP